MLTGSAIELDGLTKTFGEDTAKPFTALAPTTLRIEPGEFVSVVGPSGCGKSTMMLMTGGLLAPTAGTVRVDGKEVTRPVTEVGIAFQDHLLLDFRTAMDNVMLQASVRRLPKAEIRARAEELFERLGLTKAADRYPAQLSGGMRQRVSIARTLVHNPPLLMMDEPFGALDALTRLQVRADLERLWMERHPTVLFITHSVDEAVGLSDRVIVMSPSPGGIVEEIEIDLPRPRPLAVGESRDMTRYIERIYAHFEQMGVLRGVVNNEGDQATEASA
jgi:NitT/TauT family transport system ATP-binding protein